MRNLLITLALVAIAATTQADTSTNTNSDSKSLQGIQEQFYRLAASIDLRLKNAARERLDIMHQLLDEAGDAVWSRELARLSGRAATTEFDDLLVEALIERLVKTKKADRLESLLRINCPDFVANVPLEYLLARSELPDPILVLPHAYSLAETNASKDALVRCLARAFPRLWESKKADPSFVSECETWWTTNRSACTVNLRYPYLVGGNPRDHQKPLKGLFLLAP